MPRRRPRRDESKGVAAIGHNGGPVWIEPVALNISNAVKFSGLSRSDIYRRLGSGELVGLKSGRTILIQVESLKRVVAALPHAQINIAG